MQVSTTLICSPTMMVLSNLILLLKFKYDLIISTISRMELWTLLETIIEFFMSDLKLYVESKDLHENESRLGYALIELFEDYGNIFIGNDNNKFNKNIVLLTLREMTNMNTKEIRVYLKKYKTLYFQTLNKIHNR